MYKMKTIIFASRSDHNQMVSSLYSFSNTIASNTDLNTAWVLDKLGQWLILLSSPTRNDLNNKQK